MRSFTLSVLMGFGVGCAAQNMYDARIMEYTGLRYACGDAGTPVLKIRNVGTAIMGTCVVETWSNGIMVNTFDWQLAIPSLEGETRQPALPAVPGVVEGDVLEFRIISVNGEPDEGPEGNVLTVEIGATPEATASYLVQVNVNAGAAPDSLVWSITDALAQVVAQGGPLVSAGDAEFWVELQPNACYMVRVAELGGDPAGDATVTMLADGQEAVALVAGSVAEPARAGLVTGAALSVAERFVSVLQLAPNPARSSVRITASPEHGACQLRVLDVRGVVVFTRSVPASGTYDLDLSGWATGLYTVEWLSSGTTSRARLAVEQ